MTALAAGVGAAAGGGGLILGGISMVRAKKDAKKRARIQRKVTAANVKELRREAVDTVRIGREQVRQHYWQASILQGSNRASAAASGVSTDFGSVAAIESQNAQTIAADAQVLWDESLAAVRGIHHQIKIAQLGGEVNVAGIKQQGQAQRFQGIGMLIRSGSQFVAGAATTHSELTGT